MESKVVAVCDTSVAATKPTENRCQLGLLQMPPEILENILSYLTFNEISICRQACKQLNVLASSCLSTGFIKADKLHGIIQREVKAKLPRRESERRNHPLARHVDILSAIETRLSLLSMTYSKYIDLGLCCFIPGKVLDEIYHILKSVRLNPNPPRTHELLQELRDISSMAMEHFDEKIAPSLRSRSVLSLSSSSTGQNPASSHPFQFKANSALSLSEVTYVGIRQNQISQLRRQLRQTRVEMRRRVGDRNQQIDKLSRKVSELSRRIVEFDQRFDEITAEVTRVRVTEDVRIKQKCLSTTDAPSTSSAGEISAPEHRSIASGPQSGAFSCSGSVSNTNTDSRKRKAVTGDVQVPKSKCSKTVHRSAVDSSNMQCLRSGRVWK